VNPQTVITKFTNTNLESIEGIVPGNNKFIVLTNKTNRVLTLKQLSGTATNQIDTGVGGDLDLENNSSIMLYRDTTSNVWRVIGGTGSGGGDSYLIDTTPIGTVLQYSGTDLPENYIWAHNQELSRTAYAELFAVVGTSFGEGDGSTTFNA